MREERLSLRPFEDFRISNYESIQAVNEHARAKIRGSIPFERREDYMRAGRQTTWVQVVAVSEGKEWILFYGVIEQIQIEIRNRTCMAELRLCSGTRLMDYELHTRSFQNKKLIYREVLDVCSQGYEKSAKIMTEGRETTIPHFIMQYQETDWEFIKRLAAMNHTVVCADCSTKGEKYYFGLPERKAVPEDSLCEYQVEYDMGEYWNKKGSGLSIREEDAASYILEGREAHFLGEKKILNGKERYIWKIECSLKGNELYHTCYMKSRTGLQAASYANPKLAGVSLLAQVVGVKDEKVRIKINCDENKEKSGTAWYSFSTVYSSPDGTGWYCMPENGDLVRLYFPTGREEDAYVASAYHEEEGTLRTHPECKFWRNKEGKEIRLTPERILLTNNQGSYVSLSDEEGIEMVSKGTVTIRSGNSLSIISENSSIELSAPKKISLKQGQTEMSLGGEISMQGAKVML